MTATRPTTFAVYSLLRELRARLVDTVRLHPEPIRMQAADGGFTAEIFTRDGNPAYSSQIDQLLCDLVNDPRLELPEGLSCQRIRGPYTPTGCWTLRLPPPVAWQLAIRW